MQLTIQIILHVTFLDNKAAVIRAFQTNVIFRGNSTFPNNSGGSGAGLALFMNSYMYLKPHTNCLLTIKHCQLEVQYTQILHCMELPGLVFPCFFQVPTEEQKEVISAIQ